MEIPKDYVEKLREIVPEKDVPDDALVTIEFPFENEHYMGTVKTLDVIFADDLSQDLLVLYFFLTHKGKKEKTNKVQASKSYMAAGLHWSYDRLVPAKKRLVELGLIRSIRETDKKGRVVGYFWAIDQIPAVGVDNLSRGTDVVPLGKNIQKKSQKRQKSLIQAEPIQGYEFARGTTSVPQAISLREIQRAVPNTVSREEVTPEQLRDSFYAKSAFLKKFEGEQKQFLRTLIEWTFKSDIQHYKNRQGATFEVMGWYRDCGHSVAKLLRAFEVNEKDGNTIFGLRQKLKLSL